MKAGSDAAPAGGGNATFAPGRCRSPPGGTTTSCEELADGEPLALPDARPIQCSERGWIAGLFGKADSRQKRGPAMDKTPPWRAERRGILGNQGAHTRKLERRLARHTLD